MRAIRVTAGVAAVLIYCLIVLGAVVRATNSGLSCPDWPTCYGHWLPLPGDIAAVPNIGYSYGQVMLEWVHRLVAGFLLGPLVLLLAGLTFWHRRAAPHLALMGGGLLLLLLLQGALGGVTVLDRNSPWSVAVHLGNALLVLTLTLRILAAAAVAVELFVIRPFLRGSCGLLDVEHDPPKRVRPPGRRRVRAVGVRSCARGR